MENFSWWTYLVAPLLSGGGIWGIFKAAGWIKDRIDKRRKDREEEARREIAEAVELRKAEIHVEHLDREAARQVLLQIITERNREVDALKMEILDLRHLRGLTDNVIREITRHIRKLGRQVGVIESISVQVGHDDLTEAVEKLREGVDTLDAALP